MRLAPHCLLLSLTFALTWRGGLPTCVLDSDFGFTLNCQFKKSSIFRVRNLGGVKGYVGLGFSVGDELGFRQSLSNVEGNKRRSIGRSSGGLSAYATPDELENSLSKKSEISRTYQGLGGKTTQQKGSQQTGIPPFKPIPPAAELTVLKPIIVGPFPIENVTRLAATVPQFQGLPPSITVTPASPAKAPQAFRNALQQATNNFQMQASLSGSLQSAKLSHRSPSQVSLAGPQIISVVPNKQIDDRISSSSGSGKLLPTAIPVSNSIKTEKEKPQKTNDALPPGLSADTVKKLAQATNLSVEAIAAAINVKQQQLIAQQQRVATTSTTTTTERPSSSSDVVRKYPLAGPSRVMNAPKEYYPVGYDKNFDDNFVSRVELPDTSFYCGEQKHFPGLYADEDLGCMVFHVCAFTDDGLIMKSFLCPESTLFDQSILKCNWWFYVDCKSSKKLYDSNIPISKSYQLMKALTFFSTYNKQR